MDDLAARQVQSMRLEAVIIRADGRREPMGTIAYWHRNIFVRLWTRYVRGINGKFLGRMPRNTDEGTDKIRAAVRVAEIEPKVGESVEVRIEPPLNISKSGATWGGLDFGPPSNQLPPDSKG